MTKALFPSNPILLIDDDHFLLLMLQTMLVSAGFDNLILCSSGMEAMEIFSRQEIPLVVLDLWMPKMSGEEVLKQIRAKYPTCSVIIVTASNDVETAIKCIRMGAFDYIVKPFDRNRLTSSVVRALEIQEIRLENRLLKNELLSSGEWKYKEAFREIKTQSPKMKAIFQYAEVVARTSRPILITGETGVGKEVMARAIHEISGRDPFVAINIAGLDDNLFSDTLFGHTKGAFTSAYEHRVGLIEKAQNGTLFLDEIGDLSIASQVKLLRLLQENEYFPIGGDKPKKSNARVIVATNQDLRALQKEKKFRDDLYYRLCSHQIHIPSLRERPEDLPLLVDRLLEKAALNFGKEKPEYPSELIPLLTNYPFPGNVRQLEAMIFDAMSDHTSGPLSMRRFNAIFREGHAKSTHKFEKLKKEPAPPPPPKTISFPEKLPTLKELSEMLVEEAMHRSGGNQTAAATLLGISQQALSKRLKSRRPSRKKKMGV